jgi:hypothetical protein
VLITHEYTVICEMARMEVNGRFILIGVLPNGIATPQLPCRLPALTFYNALRADSAGSVNFTGTLAELTSGKTLAQVKGMMQAIMAGPMIMPVTFNNVQFMAFGSHTWSLEIAGHEPFMTQFEVMHAPPQLRVSPPGGVVR